MKRVIALLLLPLLLLAVSAQSFGVLRGGSVSGCAMQQASASQGTCCEEQHPCTCELAPGGGAAPESPVLPVTNSRVLEQTLWAIATVPVAEVTFPEREGGRERSGEISPLFTARSVPHIVLHCSFRI